MNYSNEENVNQAQNNNSSLRLLNNNNKNEKISRRKQKYKTENNNPEIVEFKSQENLIFVKNPQPIQNLNPYLRMDKAKKQKQLFDSSNNIINKGINTNNENKIPQTNKSNSSVKINTKINSKKYFAKNTSKRLNNNNTNEKYSNDIHHKEIINSNNNISSNNFNLIYPGQNSVKIKGNKMINHYNNIKNNHLTMTKSSIQITGNYPLNQSQNIYYNQPKIESMELSIEGNSRGRYNRNNNLENNETTYIQNKYINNQDYKNKTHLVKREINNKVIDYYNNDNNNLTPITVPYEKFIYNDNLENPENQNTKIYSNYNSNNSYINYNRVRNNLAKSTNVDSEKNIQFGKNNNEYNNIFFYNSNSNNNDSSNYKSEKFSFNEDKSNFHYRGNNIINNNVDIKEYNKNTVKYNKVYSNSNSNSNIISVSNVKENKMKNKFIYKKSGNLSEKKIIKANSLKNNSQVKDNYIPSTEQKIFKKNTKNDKSKFEKKSNNVNKKEKEQEKNIINYNKYVKEGNKNNKRKEYNKNITIKRTEIKNKLTNSYDLVDFKLKIPNNNLEKEEIYTININKDNISEKVENIIKENSLDNDYIEPLLSLVNNSINYLKNIKDMNIKKIEIQSNHNRSKLFKENNEDFSSKDTSEVNNLDYSDIIDLIEKNKYKEYLEDIYSDIDEINENIKIMNMSI